MVYYVVNVTKSNGKYVAEVNIDGETKYYKWINEDRPTDEQWRRLLRLKVDRAKRRVEAEVERVREERQSNREALDRLRGAVAIKPRETAKQWLERISKAGELI